MPGGMDAKINLDPPMALAEMPTAFGVPALSVRVGLAAALVTDAYRVRGNVVRKE